MNRIRSIRVPVIVALIIGGMGCSRQCERGVPPELVAVINAFYASIDSGDVEARIALFADSAIMMPNHWTSTRGKAAIAEGMRAGAGAVFLLRDRRVLDMDACGDVAYTVNSYYYTWHAAGSDRSGTRPRTFTSGNATRRERGSSTSTYGTATCR